MNKYDEDYEVLMALVRSDLNIHIRKTFLTVSPADDYMENWHIQAMAYHLQQVLDGKCKRLIITMPPRHGKSIATSVAFPSFILGHRPDARIIGMSYSQDLATKFSIDTRTVMDQPWYLNGFPQTRIRKKQDTQEGFFTTRLGYRMSTSVGGSLTGHGGDFLIIDDPHKAEEAQSETKRKQVIDWFNQTVATRLNDPENGCIVLVQQRFHEDDLAGHLLDQGGWTHLNLPALAEGYEEIPIGPNQLHIRNMGDPLHPERMSADALKDKREEMGPLAFAGQYQQRPSPAGGAIVQREWLRSYGSSFRPKPQHHMVIQSWDPAFTINGTSKFTVCTTWAYQDYRLYLLHVLRSKMKFHDLRKYIPFHADKYGASKVLIEASGPGEGLYDEIQRLNPSLYMGSKPTLSKEIRLLMVVQHIALGRLVLPETAPWLQCFLDELLGFPNTKHDDQVDTVSQVFKWLQHYTDTPPYGYFDDDE
jgi:predicted phage terminase large subunit-like protein